MDIDIEAFISEIQAKPAIWDCKSTAYANKNQKDKSWEDICRIFYEDFDSKESHEKNELCRTLQRKWRSLRDSFVREVNLQNKEAKSGSASSSRRKYIFFEQLCFLRPTVINRNTSSSLDKTNDYQEEEPTDKEANENELQENEFQSVRKNSQSANITEKTYSVRRKRGLNQIESAEMTLLNAMSKRLTADNQTEYSQKEYDEDRHFLLSLVNDLKKVPEDNKLDAKTELMEVLKKWQRAPNSTLYNSPIFERETPVQLHGTPFQHQTQNAGPRKRLPLQPQHAATTSKFQAQYVRQITCKKKPKPYPIPSDNEQDILSDGTDNELF